MKLTVIGGGGVRSMFLSKSIAVYGRGLGIDRLTLMDNDPVKLNIFGTMAKALAARIDPELKVELTTDPVRALDGTDYVITTIRVGGDDLRVKDARRAVLRDPGAGDDGGGRVFVCHAIDSRTGRLLPHDGALCRKRSKSFQFYQSRRHRIRSVAAGRV